jgi:MscS family membrane protein
MSPNRIYTLRAALAIFLFALPVAYMSAQLPESVATPPPKTEPATKTDPLGRETPRGTVIGFLKYLMRGDFAIAAQYMQPPPGKNINLAQIANEMEILSPSFKGNIGLLSDDPNGNVEAGLPPGKVRAGVVTIGETTTELILVRVDDPASGKIWLLSAESVAEISKIYHQSQGEAPTDTDRIGLAIRRGRQVLGMSFTQWLIWLLSIPSSWLLAWLASILIGAPKRILYRLRKLPCRTIWQTPLGTPLKCIFALLIHSLIFYALQPPLLYRVYYFRFIAALLVGSLAWLASRIADRGFDLGVKRLHTQKRGAESILILMRRLSHVVTLIVALIAAMAVFGLNVTTMLAGLGIGGLAIALAAQKTLENLIGGVSLLMDKAVQVGDVCKIGDQVGRVEDIGLRSLKLRTLEQNLLIVPNGSLSQMHFENMKSRTKLLINENFSLRIETQVEQLRFILNGIQDMLDKHSDIESATSRIRVIAFAGAAFELELFAYGLTGDWATLTAIRQDVLLKIAEIVEAAGVDFAAPTQLTYFSTDARMSVEKSENVTH